jgi:hypothetical protein
MSANIIDLASRQQARALHGLGCERPSPANLFSIHSPSLLSLPFVTLPLEQCADWGEFWKRTTMWNDEPTDKGHLDFARGRRYAREAIAALIEDGAQSRGLEMVVDTILDRGFSRRGPGGRLCRQLSWAETAFLHELCKIAVEAVRQKGMPPAQH